jgi:hypothetical protein
MAVQVAKLCVCRDDVVTLPARYFRHEVIATMRSGWPHTQADHGRLPADRRRGRFGPDISWPTGYSDLEYREGDYRYSAPAAQARAAQPPAAQGQHPYADLSAAGYGDDGYRDAGYDGPAAQSRRAEIRLYNPLFAKPNPDAASFAADLNPQSLEVLSDARVEPDVADAASSEAVQFERQGYFVRDADSTSTLPVFNRTIGLRDTFAKEVGKG